MQIRLRFTMHGRDTNNIVFFRYPPASPPNQSRTNALATATATNFSANLAPRMGAQTIFQGVNIRDVNTAGQIEFIGSTTPQAGTAVVESMPNNVALCVSLPTGTTGPGGRGRLYLGGWSEAENDATGQISSAASTAAFNFCATLNNDVAAAFGSPSNWVVARRNHPAYTIPAVNVAAQAGQSNNVLNFLVRDTVWDSQRRRVQ